MTTTDKHSLLLTGLQLCLDLSREATDDDVLRTVAELFNKVVMEQAAKRRAECVLSEVVHELGETELSDLDIPRRVKKLRDDLCAERRGYEVAAEAADLALDGYINQFREVLPRPRPTKDDKGYTVYESTMGTLRRIVSEHAKLSVDTGILRGLLLESLDEWEYAVTYKGEYFDQKHGDSVRIAEMRKELLSMEAA